MYRGTLSVAETAPNPEAFASLAMMQELIVHDLYENGRIDEQGKVQPLEIQRRQHDPNRWILGMGPRLESIYTNDIVPTPEMNHGLMTEEGGMLIRNRSVWSPDGKLYQTLARRKNITLTVEQVAEETADWSNLGKALDYSGQYEAVDSDEQLSNGLHITRKQQPHAEFARTRIYVQAGYRALGIARDMIEGEANFRYAKIWYPSPTTEPQVFRQDTPIFEVETFAQLESTIRVLRQLKATGQLPDPDQKEPIMGAAVEDLPGVYVGQTGQTSFNGRMSNLFGPALYDAYLDTPRSRDESITQDWVTQVALKAREQAAQKAEEWGVDPHHHAFLQEQPVDKILQMLKQ